MPNPHTKFLTMPVGVTQDVRAVDLVVEHVEAEGRLRLRLAIELPLESPDPFGCLQARRQSPLLLAFGSAPEVRALPSAGITRPQRHHDPVRRPPGPPPDATLRPRPSSAAGLPRLPASPFQRAVSNTPADRTGACVDRFPVRAAFPGQET